VLEITKNKIAATVFIEQKNKNQGSDILKATYQKKRIGTEQPLKTEENLSIILLKSY
jgi:hypothetical protein